MTTNIDPRFLLALSVAGVMILITVLMLMILMRIRSGIHKRYLFYYSLGFMLVFALTAFIGYITHSGAFPVFVGMQIVALVLGSLHCWLMFEWQKWPKRDSFWPEMVFTLFITMLGITGYMLLSAFLELYSYTYFFCTSFIFFCVPFMVLKAFDYAWAIPGKRFKQWFYPLGNDVPNPMEFDLSDHMKVIALEFEPSLGKQRMNIKIKAPERMELGHYFMSFIEQYNLRNPEEPIEYADENQLAYGWLFFQKTPWYKTPAVYDAEVTINDNKIRENDTIVAERVFY